MRCRLRRVAPWLLCLGLAACAQDGLRDRQAAVVLDRPYFDCKVQPVLTKYCATFACHGDGRRYLRLYARNRLRLGGQEKDRNAFLKPAEREANFLSASSMVDPAHPEASLLLLKPLDQAAGGYFHRGETLYGQGDVFAATDDTDYQVLVDWVNGATEDPSCVEPGSDQ